MPRPSTAAVGLLATALMGAGLLAPPAHAGPIARRQAGPARGHVTTPSAWGRERAVSSPAPAPGRDASVSFPIAVPTRTQERITALARTTGSGALRRAEVKALAPPAAKAEAVVSWAASRGFQVVSFSPWLVEVRGDAAALATALGTSTTTRTLSGKRYAVAHGALHVPAGLRDVVGGAIGLDERPRFHHHSSSFGGGDVQAINDLPVRGGSAGADVTVGTLNLSGWHPSDLNEYDASFGLRPPVIQSVVVGAGHVLATSEDDDSGGAGEVTLDAEAVSGVAPAATQRMYFGGNSDADFVAVLSKMADDATAGTLQTASASWGLCETQVGATEIGLESAQIDRMVAAGATFFASSGDEGSYGCSSPEAVDTSLTADWPAAAPGAVAVGGTSVTGDAHDGYGAPTAWSMSNPTSNPAFAGFGSGGGCSAFEIEPAAWGAPTTGCGTARAVPDIAGLANPDTGYWVFDSVYGWQLVGGTSLASPVSAASLAAYLSSQADKHGVGDIHHALFAHPADFTDVTSGTNGAYSAATGYDLVTGLGAPDWRLLGADIRGLVAGPVAAPSSSPFFAAPDAWNLLDVPYIVDYNGGGVFVSQPAFRQDASRGSSAGCPQPTLIDNPAPSQQDFPTFTLGSGTADGPVTVTVLGNDSAMGCRATTRTVFLDRHSPYVAATATYTGTTTPKYALSWTFSDPAPSSGPDFFVVDVVDNSTGVTRVDQLVTTARSLPLTATAGHAYTLSVTGYDKAGNANGVSTATFRAPFDDKAGKLSTHLSGSSSVPDWSRKSAGADYLGSHLQANRAGAYYQYYFNGKTLTAGMLKSRYGGYADVYVEGVWKKRISLYATSTLYRQKVLLFSGSFGYHRLVVKVAGSHPSGSLGSYVFVDSLAIT